MSAIIQRAATAVKTKPIMEWKLDDFETAEDFEVLAMLSDEELAELADQLDDGYRITHKELMARYGL